ncbi:MAG: hypothetical protein SFU83_01230 [Meiothermus sp.]|nr:hypothetical protein [Meiothermus sp.]
MAAVAQLCPELLEGGASLEPMNGFSKRCFPTTAVRVCRQARTAEHHEPVAVWIKDRWA